MLLLVGHRGLEYIVKDSVEPAPQQQMFIVAKGKQLNASYKKC